MLNETDTQALVSSEPKRRMTDADRAAALKWAMEGLSQTEIARRLGFSQQAVSAWLALCRDSTEAAKQYLDGRALAMARKIDKKGRPADLVNVLKGRGVLKDETASKVTVLVGAGGFVDIGQGRSLEAPTVVDATATVNVQTVDADHE